MRTIKFRAWHKELNKMFSAEEMGQDQLTLMPDGRGFANISSASTMLSTIDNGNKMIPLQYTGLPDKNGDEICAGDRLKYKVKGFPIRTAVVEASPGRFTFYWEEEIDGEFHTNPLYVYSDWCWEIIGNIYEIQSQS